MEPVQVERFYLGCLAHASYMIGSEGVAAVIDPQRDVDIYLEAAAGKELEDRIHYRDSPPCRLRLGTSRTCGTHRRAHLSRRGIGRGVPSRRGQGRRRDSVRRLPPPVPADSRTHDSRAFAF